MRAGTRSVAAIAVAAAAAIGLGLAAPAHAQPSASAAATLQFDRGRALMKEKKYAEACAAFEQSQKLDPQIGTLYNLASCWGQLGKIASAWNAYREVGQRDTNADRKKEANKRARELEKRLTKLVLKTPAAPPAGLVVTMNGVDVTALLGTDSPVDPAEYKLKATAPGFATWETTAKIADEGKTITIAIELQKPGPKPDPVRTPVKPPVTPPVADPPKPKPDPVAVAGPTGDPDDVDRPAEPPRSRRKTYAVIVGAGGLAALGTGLVFGNLARSKWAEAKELCGDDRICDSPATLERGNQLADTAERRARLSTVLVAGGAVLVGAGVVLWLTAPSGGTRTSTALHLAPQAGPGHAGVTLGGRF